MISQGVVQMRVFLCCFGLHLLSSFLVGSTSSTAQDLASNTKAAQSRESESASSYPTDEIVKPSLIRSRRSNLFSENEPLYDRNADLNSAFLYNDQIMQNLLSSPPSKPLSYAHSNFFLNYLKPRTTRYNAWDDHSLMHFGKRSLENNIDNKKVLVKRSTDFWSPNNVLHFGKKSEISDKGDEASKNAFDVEKDEINSDVNVRAEDYVNSNSKAEKEYPENDIIKKSIDPWHNMMSFGKRNEPWHSMMSFGKRDEPWHSMMSFGKRDEPWHSMMSFGKRDDPWHNMMSFGKRFDNTWDHNTLHFGKRDPWDHSTLHFGKRDPWDHNTLHFGKRDDPWHSMMSFGKRHDSLWDHNTLHFGKRDDPWHNMMSFGKKSENSDMTDLEKRDDPWHTMMSFGKKSHGLLNNSITIADKRDEPWHSMMSFGKKSDYGFDHNTLHFGKREDPWHSMMSFGKKSETPWDHDTLHFGKRDEPWHSMMSFGKKLDPLAEKNNLLFEQDDSSSYNMLNNEKREDGAVDDVSEDFSRNSDPWYEYDGMVFYKKSNPWDHNTLHFGKKSNATWESALPTEKVNSNHVKKRSLDMWNNHHTMHFGKKFDPWDSHNTMHFGKKSDYSENHNVNNFENKEEYDDINKEENIDKKIDWDSHNTMHFGKRDPGDYRNTFLFNKRNPWDYHNTMHFGKRDPWDYQNTMHFGKRDPWDNHNTMHFGKRNPWDYNKMHLGSDSDFKDGSISKDEKSVDQKEDKSHNLKKNTEDNIDRKTNEKESSIKKRSSVDSKSNERTKNKEIIKEKPDQASDNPKRLSEDIQQPLENFKSTISSKNKEHMKSGITTNLSTKDHTDIQQLSDKKSHIQKRSVRDDPNANIDLVDKYSKDNVVDNVLHFGKRSIEIEDEDEDLLLDGENEKRLDDFWNDHNTLHFGKKSDPWDNHNTLHFGKKSNPQNMYSIMPTTKRDPWDQKIDRWDSHATMHFGKRTDNWDHNVMHFGKRKVLTPDEYQVLSTLDSNPDKLNDYIQSLNTEQDDSSENIDFLDNLIILKSIINSRLKDDNIPFEERVNLLRQYLKPILKAIIDAQGSKFILYPDPNDNDNELEKDYSSREEVTLEKSKIIPLQAKDGIKYDETTLRKENDDSSYGEYGDNLKTVNTYPNESENLLKSKRKYLGKPELKRYFIPFQGPKSIVYPHAWFASQIRRSSLPRTTDYARHMEMRMAEKKEDPFNSYMHFGRR